MKAERAHRVACFFTPFKFQIVTVLVHLILELLYNERSFVRFIRFYEFCRALDVESTFSMFNHFIFPFWKMNVISISFVHLTGFFLKCDEIMFWLCVLAILNARWLRSPMLTINNKYLSRRINMLLKIDIHIWKYLKAFTSVL